MTFLKSKLNFRFTKKGNASLYEAKKTETEKQTLTTAKFNEVNCAMLSRIRQIALGSNDKKMKKFKAIIDEAKLYSFWSSLDTFSFFFISKRLLIIDTLNEIIRMNGKTIRNIIISPSLKPILAEEHNFVVSVIFVKLLLYETETTLNIKYGKLTSIANRKTPVNVMHIVFCS